jgi:hypothetical protein
MGLDMYAFSLDRSEAFAKPRDVLKFRAPATGQDLPQGPILLGITPELWADLPPEMRQMFPPWVSTSASMDPVAMFLTSKYVLPGSTLLHRWRKHPDLHGWMQRRWNVLRSGMLRKEFNSHQRVPLDVQDLDTLEHAVMTRRLPPTVGPHFGVSDGTEMADDLAFIAAARRELAAGKFVYYTSWW